jgi:hypothetical protein
MIVGGTMIDLDGDRLTITAEGGDLAMTLTIDDPREFVVSVLFLLDQDRIVAESAEAGARSNSL